MRYPNPWKAESKVRVYSRVEVKKQGAISYPIKIRIYGLTLYVDSPGTSHHGRAVSAEMERDELQRLYMLIGSLLSDEPKDDREVGIS